MNRIDRIARLQERIAGSKFASESEHIMNVVRGVEPVRHGMAVEVERATGKRLAPNGAEYHVKIRASTESIARDSGIIPMRAWEKGGLKNFAENPIILAYHDHKQPIGRSVHTELTSSSLIEYWEFHGESDISRLMQTLYERGFMRAASVGFLVHEFSFVDELDDKQMEALVAQYGAAAARDIYWIAERAELLETSAVPVPSDANALNFSFAARSAEAVGIDTSAISQFLPTSEQRMDKPKIPATGSAEGERAEATGAEAVAPAAAATEPTMRELMDAISTLATAVGKLAEKSAAPAAVVTPPASAPAGGESAAAETERAEDEFEITIEKLDGESDEECIARFVDLQVAKLRGAPVPSKK